MHRGLPDLVGLRLEPVEEVLLATDAAQHAQTGDGVGGDGGGLAEAGSLRALAPLQRADEREDRKRDQRHADDHDQAEGGLLQQQDHRDGDEGDDRAGEAARDVEAPTRCARRRWR